MDADRSRAQASLPSLMWIFSAPFNLFLTLSQSLDPASIWGPGSSLLTGSLFRLFSGGHKVTSQPCWSGLEARLWFQQQLTQPSKDQTWAKKEVVGGGKSRGMAAQCGWVEDKATGRAKGQRRRLQPEGIMGRREDFKTQTIKDRKEWHIGELGPGKPGWHPRLCMNNQVSHMVSWVRLRWSPGSQNPSTTMRELTTQGKNCWYPHPTVSFQERLTYNVTDLICIH